MFGHVQHVHQRDLHLFKDKLYIVSALICLMREAEQKQIEEIQQFQNDAYVKEMSCLSCGLATRT